MNIDLNLRGSLIMPATDTNIKYYLLFIDFPNDGTFRSSDFVATLPAPGSNAQTIQYTYTGVLPDSPTDNFKTYALMYTVLEGMDPEGANQIIITDQQTVPNGGPNICSGDPSRLHPPIVEYTFTDNVKCSPFVIQSKSSGDYFVVIMLTLTSAHGIYKTRFSISEDETDSALLVCYPELDHEVVETGSTVVALGFHISSSLNQYSRVCVMDDMGVKIGFADINYIPSI